MYGVGGNLLSLTYFHSWNRHPSTIIVTSCQTTLDFYLLLLRSQEPDYNRVAIILGNLAVLENICFFSNPLESLEYSGEKEHFPSDSGKLEKFFTCVNTILRNIEFHDFVYLTCKSQNKYT